MVKIVICDDNSEYLNKVSKLVEAECLKISDEDVSFEICSAFEKGADVLEYAKRQSFDVLLLDIDMPGMSGFELAKVICAEYPDMIIVFISAYDNYVYDSFEFSPFAFLRKSHMESELPRVLKRIAEKALKSMIKLSFEDKSGSFTVPADEILYFESSHNYFYIYCTNGKKYKLRGTLSEVEEKTKGYNFIRIHSGFIINIEKVSKIVSNYSVIIENAELPISQKMLAGFKKAYMSYTRRSI